MNKPLSERLIAYRRVMAMVKAMHSEGVITSDDYAIIDTIMTNKYGLSSCSIFSDNDWICHRIDGNM